MYIYKVGVVGAGTMGGTDCGGGGFCRPAGGIGGPRGSSCQARRRIGTAIYQARVAKGKMTPEQLEEKMLLVTASPNLEAP